MVSAVRGGFSRFIFDRRRLPVIVSVVPATAIDRLTHRFARYAAAGRIFG